MPTNDIDGNIKKLRNHLYEILEKECECNKFASEKDVINLVNPRGSELCRGVYIFLDKNSKKCYYVGQGGCDSPKNPSRLPVRIYKQFNYPIKKKNIGGKFRKKLGWEEEKIKKFTKEKMSFCFKVLDNCDEIKKLEHFCIAALKPELND